MVDISILDGLVEADSFEDTCYGTVELLELMQEETYSRALNRESFRIAHINEYSWLRAGEENGGIFAD